MPISRQFCQQVVLLRQDWRADKHIMTTCPADTGSLVLHARCTPSCDLRAGYILSSCEVFLFLSASAAFCTNLHALGSCAHTGLTCGVCMPLEESAFMPECLLACLPACLLCLACLAACFGCLSRQTPKWIQKMQNRTDKRHQNYITITRPV